ncbi:hypothetical protein ACRRVB_03070 [Candidatus Cardinium hertigii]|uniref:hypothetical protein n=1 Tax=Candidatus Cardinium hertigii TaxID=247481 RepID=UPI003D7D39BE
MIAIEPFNNGIATSNNRNFSQETTDRDNQEQTSSLTATDQITIDQLNNRIPTLSNRMCSLNARKKQK